MFKKPLIIIGIAHLACLIVAVIAFTVVLVIDMSHDDDFFYLIIVRKSTPIVL